MKVAIVDADLIGRAKHRFPNLACMKLSSYWKAQGAEVTLKTNYEYLRDFDHVFVSKVFTNTEVPFWLEASGKIHLGGSGFFFDKAPPLPMEIEHRMPDYHLYDAWASRQKPFEVKEYLHSSIGFLTRGCFRKCDFCINKKYDRVFLHSPLMEFYDSSRKSICLLDDNFLGNPEWKRLLGELQDTGKRFCFKQGLDVRLLNDEKAEMLFASKYDGDYTFAFDNFKDFELIEKKLKLIRRHTAKDNIRFYTLVGFDSTDHEDIRKAFLRIRLMMQYNSKPYIMRYQSAIEAPWKQSPLRGFYVTLARWCNQPNFYKRKSFREFCSMEKNSTQILEAFEAAYPDIAAEFFDLKYMELSA